jgi:hypothetical protein
MKVFKEFGRASTGSSLSAGKNSNHCLTLSKFALSRPPHGTPTQAMNGPASQKPDFLTPRLSSDSSQDEK